MTTEQAIEIDPECLRLAEEAYASDWRKLKITRASEIDMEATEWLWEDSGHHWIPRGGLTLLGGREGIGKTTMAYRIAAMVTNGTLPGSGYGVARNVIVSATEDSWKRTVKPRLAAVGADMERIFRVEAVTPEGLEAVSLPEDTVWLRRLVLDNDVALIILDPLMSVINAKHDTHRDAEVRRALEPVVKIAEDTNAALVGLIHQKKGTEGDLRQRLMASVAFVAVSRSVLYCAKRKPLDTDNDERNSTPTYWFGQIKNNLQAIVDVSHNYSVESVLVGFDERLELPITSSRIKFIGTHEENVEDIVLAEEKQARSDKAGSRQHECAAWIQGYLQDHGESMKTDVLDAAKDAGYSATTVERAKGLVVGLVATQTKGARNRVSWRIEEPGAKLEKVDKVGSVDKVDKVDKPARGLRAVPDEDDKDERLDNLDKVDNALPSLGIDVETGEVVEIESLQSPESGNFVNFVTFSTPPRVTKLPPDLPIGHDPSGLCEICDEPLNHPGLDSDCADNHHVGE